MTISLLRILGQHAYRAYQGNATALCCLCRQGLASHRKILRLRVVEDDRRGRLLGVELVFLGQRDADLARRPAAPAAGAGRRDWGRPDSRTNSGCRDSPGSASRRVSRASSAAKPSSARMRLWTYSAKRLGHLDARGRAGRGNPGSGCRRTTRAPTSEARWPTVTTCSPITSRSASSTSRKKSAMHRPSSLFWRGKAKRATSRAAVRRRTGSGRCPRPAHGQ